MEATTGNDAAIAAWRHALQRCVESKSHGVVDESIVLVYVDAPRVFHPVQALVHAAAADTSDAAAPLVVVMRLHPELTGLLQMINDAGKSSEEDLATVLESLLFQEQSGRTTNSSDVGHSALVTPLFADKRVNVDGGALYLYGVAQQTASHALTMLTLAIHDGGSDRISADFERFIAVVEHADGYLAREYVLKAAERSDTSPPRLIKIQRREWSSSAIAQLSLDDALESFEAAYLDEQEINSNGDDASQPTSLHISVEAAFEVRDLSKRAHGSIFLLDADEDSQYTSEGMRLPPVTLFSQWQGLENVRSLLCKPPPQSLSTLCFSAYSGRGVDGSSRTSLELLRRLEEAIRDGSTQGRTWRAHPDTATTLGEVVAKFKRFLKNIDQDESQEGGDDDHTNNTIESTISMALDGERDRHPMGGRLRCDMDPVEKFWDFLTKYVDGTDSLQQIFQEFVVHLSNTRVFPATHPDNDTQLAKLVRLRVDEIQGAADVSRGFTTSAQQLLTQPLDVMALVVEAGEWKMKRDVAFWLAQTGFSSQECNEFVQAMPRFDVISISSSHTHWTAMHHVLQLCSAGRSIHLPVAYMRNAVHDAAAFYTSHSDADHVDPSILIDLQSFIPDRLRANIADPLYWDLKIAFDTSYEHRVRICQDSFHATAKSSMGEALVLDDATLRALHRNAPDALKQRSEMIKFMTKLEDDREKRLYEQLHDIDMPTGMTRYDCTVRTLHDLT